MPCRNEVSPGQSAGLEEDLARHLGTSPHIYARDLDLKGCVSGVSGWEQARIVVGLVAFSRGRVPVRFRKKRRGHKEGQ